ncbi:MAG: hypothetical protein K0S14_155 [Thermomicrobiales bacterium]|jgi:hypothetical protein|nr:hypothetical protein [Thermomicrobiales bacterium]MDF3014996.1 hypothetical protein [Thermomicrobiales bacterium]
MSDQQITDSTSETLTVEKVRTSEEHQPYLYQHAGIEEHEGRIPLWLAGVVAGLLIWSVYYMIRYWSEP